MYKCIIILLTLINVFGVGQSALAHANTFYQGSKQINLRDNKGNRLLIGAINFSIKEEVVHYQIHLKHKLFKDYFLSMKEMKCFRDKV